ncbi:hypothetical protein M422DRAFT_258671 [Sphaerobolus stellatus SS14]|uniref:CCHC-type domain-containing protein n=1 Tax=Sphaerobolus stellatus (strain SS14) TaxID=990650 RepID=A0A0C9U6C4_SPHS4|nr:hypothetical protein M422DRAFT_258671 [Sphaerobolus stellatus SS14]
MSHNCGPRRAWAEELSTMDVEDSEPTTGLTTGDLTNSLSPSVDPQQSPRMLPSEHPDEPHATAHGSQTGPSREQSPSRVGVRPRTATQGMSPSQLAGASGTAHRGSHTPLRVASMTATQGRYFPRGITHRSESRSKYEQVSPTRGDTEEDFIIKASEVVVLHQEYSEFITLKDNAEIVLAEAMEATEQLNTVVSRVRASMNRMSPRMKELFLVPSTQVSGKTLEPGNNQAHDRAAAQAATQCIIAQTTMIEPAPVSGAEERARTTCSHVPGDQYSRAPLSRNTPEDIPHTACGKQGEDSQPRCDCEVHTVYAHDTPEAQVRDTSRARLARDIRVNSTESTQLRHNMSPINTGIRYDGTPEGNMTMQQLHQELTKFMDALKPNIREEVLGKGFTAEFSKIDVLVAEAVTVDNAKCYTSGYNSSYGSAYLNKPANAATNRVQQNTTQNKSSNVNAGSSNQHRSGNNNFQNQSTPQLLNPVRRTAPKANNTVVCFNCNQPGHIQPNCPFPDKDRRIAGVRIEEVILEEDESQIEEFDKYAPHPEEQQEFEDQPEEDDQQYCFDDEEYETRSIDNDVVHVNAVIKASGYNDCH